MIRVICFSAKLPSLISSLLLLMYLMYLFPANVVAGKGTLSTGIDDVAQLPFWEWQDGVMSIRLVQRLPDQTRAFFMARGFDKQHAEIIAQSCIFQTVYKNIAAADSNQLLSYDLTTWQVIQKDKIHSLKVREDWDKQWTKLKVSASAKIAFAWSLIRVY